MLSYFLHMIDLLGLWLLLVLPRKRLRRRRPRR
jgi:hypothetical protein